MHHNSPIHIAFLAEAAEINRKILDGYRQLREQDFLRRSHFFGGRYENLYLERETIPVIGRVLEQAQIFASELLQRPEHTLRCGFWLNDMGSGEATTEIYT